MRALQDVRIAFTRKTPIILTYMCELNMVFYMLGAWVNAQIASMLREQHKTQIIKFVYNEQLLF